MVIKCDNCGGRVKFNIEKQLFNCESCDRLIENVQIEKANFKFDRYHCASCGAELNVNEGEMTSDCPYCGAQSIVYDGDCENYDVDYIVPFKVTYNNAINIIRSEFDSYKYAPKAVKNFEVENVRPLYIPYNLYDVHIDTKQIIEGVKHSEAEEFCSYWFEYTRAIDMEYDEIEVDMSTKLPSQLAFRLAPWNIKEKEEFNPAYIAGLCALAADADEEVSTMEAVRRAKKFIYKKVMDSCKGTINKIVSAKYRYKITQKKTVLLPVWFFASSYKGQKYSVVINGQTGKIISAVPYFKPVFMGMSMFVSISAAAIMTVWLGLACAVFWIWPVISVALISALGTVYIGILAKGNKKYKEYREKINLLNRTDVVGLAEEVEKI